MTISIQKSVLSAIGGLALLFNTGTALSASSASAWIDWNTFTISVLDLGSGAPGYSLSDEWTSVNANDGVSWNSDYATDWASPISASIGGAYAEADDSQLFASAQSSNGLSNSYVYRSATIEVSGYGWLLFSVDYVISAAIDGHPDHYASAYVNFWADIESQNGWENLYASSSIEVDGAWSSADEISKSKKLGLALLVNDGDIIHFDAQASAYVGAVPVPAAVWFFGSALVGLISFGRRRAVV